MEPSGAIAGASLSHVEAILGRRTAILGPFGAILDHLGGMLGLWAALVTFLGRLGSLGEPQGGAIAAQGPSGGGVVHASGREPEAAGFLRR